MRAEEAIKRADLCVLVIDATSGVTMQDKKIAGLIQKSRKAALVALNKWDLVSTAGQSESELLRKHIERVREQLFFLDYAPVVALSARTGGNVRRLFTDDRKNSPACDAPDRHRRVESSLARCDGASTASLTRQTTIQTALRHTAGAAKPEPFQVPKFLLFVNDPRLLPETYMNFLRARLREKWEYPGLPILLMQRGREKRL